MRLARLTGPPEPVAGARQRRPEGGAGAQLREVLALGSAASIRSSAASSSGSGSGEASIAASPIVLTSRTGGSATSAGERFQARRQATELLRRDFLAERA